MLARLLCALRGHRPHPTIVVEVRAVLPESQSHPTTLRPCTTCRAYVEVEPH